jgi:hypothetical protein
MTSDEEDFYHYLRMELDPEEQTYYERLTGIGNGGKIMSPEDTAKDLNVPIEKVYSMKRRLKNKITGILKQY